MATLVDLADRPTWGDGVITFHAARLPSGERIAVRIVSSIVAYLNDGDTGPQAVERSRGRILHAADRQLSNDPELLMPGDRPDDLPWIFVRHEDLDLS